MWDHFMYLYNLFICVWRFCILFMIIAKSSAYAIVVHVKGDVLK